MHLQLGRQVWEGTSHWQGEAADRSRSRMSLPSLESRHPDGLAGPPWVSDAASLFLNIPACKMGRVRTNICLLGVS